MSVGGNAVKIDRILWVLADTLLVQIAAITRRVWRFIRFILVLNNRTAVMAVWIIAAVQLLGVMFTENAGDSAPHVWRLLSFVAAALAMNAAFPVIDRAAHHAAMRFWQWRAEHITSRL